MTLSPATAAREAHGAAEAVQHFSEADTTTRGAVFTRPEIVEFILDLVGYTEDRPLATLRLLEPAAGHADFLVPAIGRLVRSFVAHGGKPAKAGTALAGAIVAFDAHAASVITGRKAIAAELERLEIAAKVAAQLAEMWLRTDDFLFVPLEGANRLTRLKIPKLDAIANSAGKGLIAGTDRQGIGGLGRQGD